MRRAQAARSDPVHGDHDSRALLRHGLSEAWAAGAVVALAPRQRHARRAGSAYRPRRSLMRLDVTRGTLAVTDRELARALNLLSRCVHDCPRPPTSKGAWRDRRAVAGVEEGDWPGEWPGLGRPEAADPVAAARRPSGGGRLGPAPGQLPSTTFSPAWIRASSSGISTETPSPSVRLSAPRTMARITNR